MNKKELNDKGLARNEKGFWTTREGEVLEDVTSVNLDKTFQAYFLRSRIKPNEPLRYYPQSIFRVERGMPEDMFFITVIPYETPGAYPMPIPLSLLDIKDHQKEALIKRRRLPKKAFAKIPIAMDAFFRTEGCQCQILVEEGEEED